MNYLSAKEAIREMRKHGFDIVRCEDCKWSKELGKADRLYCRWHDVFHDKEWFCPDADEVRE